MKTHKDLLNLSETELVEELRSRHEIQLAEAEEQCKKAKIVDVAREIGVSIPEEVKDPELVNENSIRDRLISNNKVYLERVRVGETISKVLYEGEVREQSLSKEDKFALDLYREQVSSVNISEVVLRPSAKRSLCSFQQTS